MPVPISGRIDVALEIFAAAPPDVMNHNRNGATRPTSRARPARLRPFAATAEAVQGAPSDIPTKSGPDGPRETDEKSSR